MASVNDKLRLLSQIARLRQAQMRLPKDRDLSAVRAELEQELGETVSRRMAARFLGVSHTALARWINAGDLATIPTASGRDEVSVPALLTLHERVERERGVGSRTRHLLEPALTEGRERADRMRPEVFLDSESQGGYASADERALAYHRAVAKRLDRRIVEEALHRVWKWRDQGRLDPRYAADWERILESPLPDVRRAMTAKTKRGRDLRQNSPFAGMLSEPERRKLLKAIG